MNKTNFGIITLTEKLHISIFSVFTLLFVLIGQGFTYSIIFISAVSIHEASHIFFLSIFGAEIKRVTLYPFGIDMDCDTKRLSYKKELIVVLSGSFTNLLFALTSYAVLSFFPSPPLLFFIICNTFLALFNLIPLSFFDGGRALRLLFYDRLEIDTAFYASRYADIASALIFFVLSLYLLHFSDFNFSVCALVTYACISCLVSNWNLYKKCPDHSSR